MSEAQTVPPPLTSAETEAMRRESLELERRRGLNHVRFRWSFFGGLVFLVVSFVLVGVTKGSWWLMMPAIISLGAATSFYALERGRHPAWGLLSLPGLALLNVMPDLHAARLDEIDFRMTGAAPKRVSGERLSQAIFLPLTPFFAESLNLNAELGIPPGLQRHWAIIFAPLGLYHAIRLIFDVRQQGKSLVLPIAVTVWAACLTFVATNLLVRSFERPAPKDTTAAGTPLTSRNVDQSKQLDEVFAGNHSVVRLSTDWERQTEAPAADVDISVFSRLQRLSLRVLTVSKDRYAGKTLEEYATSYVRQMSIASTGPTKRPVGERESLQYELRGASQDSRDITYLMAFWQTDRRFYVVSGWTDTHILRSQKAKMQKAMDAVRVIE